MKLEQMEESRKLRIQGNSIKQIASILDVSKGSVSAWVRDTVIPESLLFNIENRKKLGREHSRIARLSNIARKNCELDAICKKDIRLVSIRDLWIAGIMLYAGEGYKSARVSGQRVEITNSNPDILRIFISFLEKVCLAPKQEIKIRLMLYEDIDTEETQRYWSEQLDIPQNQFRKPFIKQSYRNIPFRHLRRSKYGTAHVHLYDVVVYRKIVGWIKAFYELNSVDFVKFDREVA